MSNNYIADIQRRLAALERQMRFSNKPFSATVTANEDPDGRNRVKVSCPDVYGEGMNSPWLTNRSEVNGPNRGSVFTPKIGDKVFVNFRDGSSDAGEYFGGPRDADSTVPEEFSDPNINGIVCESGIKVIYNDNDGSYSFETDGGMLKLHQDGTMDLYGIVVNAHAPCNFNSDSAQFGVVTDSPAHLCPFSGKPHTGSTTVKAAI